MPFPSNIAAQQRGGDSWVMMAKGKSYRLSRIRSREAHRGYEKMGLSVDTCIKEKKRKYELMRASQT
jgi:hypothetical protein